MRAKIYIRVSSTRGRKELISPELQEIAARAKAEQEGIEVVDVVFDLDQSGRDFAKRKIADIIDEVRRGKYEIVLLWKWSRFGRNLRDSLNNLHELSQVGGIAISATEPGDSVTTMGKFSRNQMLSIAELQSDMIGDGWKETHSYRLTQGLPHNGTPRFGYVYQDKRYFPEPIRGDALAEVYERWVDGEPFRTISVDMADAGIRTPGGDVLEQGRWIQIMDTGFAAGLIRKKKPGAKGNRFDNWDWHQGAHEALIEPDLWEAFVEKRVAGLGRKWASPKAKYSVSGLLRCSKCMRSMTATKTDRGKVRFRCSGISTKRCSGLTILLNVANASILDWLVKRASGGHNTEEAARAEAARKKQDVDIAALKKKIDDLDKRLSRLLDVYESGDISKDEYAKRKAAREAERSTAQQELTKLKSEQTARPLPASFYKGLADAWDRISDDRKRQALKQVINYVIVSPNDESDGDRCLVVPKFG
ncbi:recombinase family protein [Nonomuraea wenchangensis]|nr:recombinase family protein [Nonomuraea wenchangensis]